MDHFNLYFIRSLDYCLFYNIYIRYLSQKYLIFTNLKTTNARHVGEASACPLFAYTVNNGWIAYRRQRLILITHMALGSWQ